jgi:uncharacterized protein YrrD
MADLGPPGSYMTLEEGMAVYSSDGEKLGEIEHVLADEDAAIFDGIVIDRSVLPGGHRFADATQVDECYERGVVLSVDAAAAKGLPEPSANPATMEVGAEDMGAEDTGDKLEGKLRRAWDRISGKG